MYLKMLYTFNFKRRKKVLHKRVDCQGSIIEKTASPWSSIHNFCYTFVHKFTCNIFLINRDYSSIIFIVNRNLWGKSLNI